MASRCRARVRSAHALSQRQRDLLLTTGYWRGSKRRRIIPTAMPRLILFIAVLALTAFAARAEDWPQFRGPGGQGHSAEHNLSSEWSESLNVAWKVPVHGLGWSSPVVADGRVWLTTAFENEYPASLRVLAFDVKTGREVLNEEIFKVVPDPYANPKNSFASPTPILDGDRVYVHFGGDGTAALKTSGEVLWRTRL